VVRLRGSTTIAGATMIRPTLIRTTPGIQIERRNGDGKCSVFPVAYDLMYLIEKILRKTKMENNINFCFIQSSTATPIPNQIKGRYCPGKDCLEKAGTHVVLRYAPIEPIIINLDTSNIIKETH